MFNFINELIIINIYIIRYAENLEDTKHKNK